MIINMQVILPIEDGDKLDLIILILILFRGNANKLINIISEAKLIKTFDDKDRLIIDKFVLFKNDTDKGNKGNDNENEMKSYNESDSENDSNGNN